jgi:hypothetical protein
MLWGKRMKRKLLAILTINLFLLVSVLSMTSVSAQGTGQWITNYTISDLKTGQILRQVDFATGQDTSNAPILAGVELNVTITVVISTTSPNTNLSLSTTMGHSTVVQDAYWDLQSSFAGVSSTYNPNQASMSFKQTTGTFAISCYGAISAGQTQTVANGITLNKKSDISVIKLTDPAGNQLDKITITVVDSKINQFDTLVATAQANVLTMNASGIDPAYISLYQSVINNAKNQASQGLVDNAISLLSQISVASSSKPVSITTPIEATLFLPAVAALAVIVVLVLFLFVRVRGKVNYDKLVIEDQIKDLEGLTLRASKVDKNLTVSLESVKDRLKSLVGA